MGAAVFDDVPDNATVIGNPARITGEGTQDSVYAPSKALEAAKKDSLESIPERYWDVFTSCFEGVDFNPVTFKYHDAGWDSVTHLTFISMLEEAFQIKFNGRETMRLKSYGTGLKMVQSKLEPADGGR